MSENLLTIRNFGPLGGGRCPEGPEEALLGNDPGRHPQVRTPPKPFQSWPTPTCPAGYLKAVRLEIFGPVFSGCPAETDPRDPPRSPGGPPRTSNCTNNQPRRPILRPSRGTKKKPPDGLQVPSQRPSQACPGSSGDSGPDFAPEPPVDGQQSPCSAGRPKNNPKVNHFLFLRNVLKNSASGPDFGRLSAGQLSAKLGSPAAFGRPEVRF